MSLDPKGFPAGSMNLYSYVRNGPTNATDPNGQNTEQMGALMRSARDPQKSAAMEAYNYALTEFEISKNKLVSLSISAGQIDQKLVMVQLALTILKEGTNQAVRIGIGSGDGLLTAVSQAVVNNLESERSELSDLLMDALTAVGVARSDCVWDYLSLSLAAERAGQPVPPFPEQ
jgi:hypothetical protein